jgi:integrase
MRKGRTYRGTITRHRGFWCLRYRERIREGGVIKTVQRSRRLAPVDAQHKTLRSVEMIAAALRGPTKQPTPYVATRLGDFVSDVYIPHIEAKRRPSTVRTYKQMWNRDLKPRCANWLMHDVETRTVQSLLDIVIAEESLGPQTMAHIKHLLSGIFRFAIAQGHLPRGTVNPVTYAETPTIPDFDGRAYSLEEIALMFSVLPEPSRTTVAVAAFAGLREGEIRGADWKHYTPGTEDTLGFIRVLSSVWRGRIGEPKSKRSKASVPVIPQLDHMLQEHRRVVGNPASGPIFANGAGKGIDLDSLYRRQMKEPLKAAGIEWEGWHGFRRGLATNLERIGVSSPIIAMILRHSSDRVTRKHYIKPPTIEAIAAMRKLSEMFATLGPKMIPTCSPEPESQVEGKEKARWVQ